MDEEAAPEELVEDVEEPTEELVGYEALATIRAVRPAMMRRVAVEIMDAPSRVTVFPYHLASMNFLEPRRVVVSGSWKEKWSPQWAPATTYYEWPQTVVVTLKDGTRQRFDGLQQVEIIGGRAVQSVQSVQSRRWFGAVIGAFDLAVVQRALDRIKSVSVDQSRALLKYGQKVADEAVRFGKDLPGVGKRQEVVWKLRWHEGALAKEVSPVARYGAADDLKKWVRQAFIEYNASSEGKEYSEALWDAMVAEMKDKAVGVAEYSSKPIEFLAWLASVPTWVWAVGGVAVALGAGAWVVVPIVRRLR